MSVRVNILAKELSLEAAVCKDMLNELGAGVKSHASPVDDKYADMLREKLSSKAEDKTEEKKQKKEEKVREERRAKATAERKARLKERVERGNIDDTKLSDSAKKIIEDASKEEEEKATKKKSIRKGEPEKPNSKKPEEKKAKTKKKEIGPKSELAVLEAQIQEELKRAELEVAEKEEHERVRLRMEEVAKKQAVEEQLSDAYSKDHAKKINYQVNDESLIEEILGQNRKKNSIKDARSVKPEQVEDDAQPISIEDAFSEMKLKFARSKAKKEQRHKAEAEARRAGGREFQEDYFSRSKGPKALRSDRGKMGKGKKSMSADLDYSYYDGQDSEHDRYAQMAAQAELMQKNKVLADAKVAVEAVSNQKDEGRRKIRRKKREAEAREKEEAEAIERGLDPELVLNESIIEVMQNSTVKEFADAIDVPANDVVKRLFMLGQSLTLTQAMSDDLIELIADDIDKKIRIVSPEEKFSVFYHDSEKDLEPRQPVVTVMGHVDHGKTSLLDAIRHTGVVESEAGGITQHIGASVVEINDNKITFIDTPGHEAFTAMRARGAQITDLIVLVVAADDGVMPQTVEAINHAHAAEVPIVVAVNKIDKNGANPDQVRQELIKYEVVPEEWGGANMFVDVSAKQNKNIDTLLETIILQADVLELKANPNTLASGFVIDANLDKGKGPVASVLVQRGTLKASDVLVAGTAYGHVRALTDPRGKQVMFAKPAEPVEIQGLNSVPVAGDDFRVFEDEREARKLAEDRALRSRLAAQRTDHSPMNLDDLFNRIEEGKVTNLNLIIKADVQGSIEALRDAFNKMDQSEVKINIVHSAVGGITETDVTLAAASDAIIIGFNVRPTGKSRQQAESENVDIRLYKVIYKAIAEINDARAGLRSPDIVEKDTGIAEVRDTFKLPKIGTIAGAYVVDGDISRDDHVRVVRDGTIVFEGMLASLKRFKEDVKVVKQGYECGIGIDGFQDIKVGDTIEGFVKAEQRRTE
ncbi:MAG: translation initiation factor IF-2 [Eggerthellaceae bacterium]|nr:translation initiation factor IF-2 [Eggerthellaceae bacterium]